VEEGDSGFEWYLVIDLCKGKSLYYYLQKRSCRPDKEIVEEKAPEPEDNMFGLGALMMAAEDAVKAVTGEEEEEIVIEEGEHYGLDEEECKQVMLQVMSCVNYLHKNRLVHAGKPVFVAVFEKREDVVLIKFSLLLYQTSNLKT
jgi:serine/threonine protein kinase